MKIVFLDRASFHKDIVVNTPNFQHEWVNFDNTIKSEIISRCADSQVIVTNKVPVQRDTLEACHQIQHIAVTATGYNIIDLDACKDHGVTVSNIPSYATITVPEHVLNVSLSLCRQLNLYRQLVQEGKWQSSPRFCLFDKPLNDLHGKTFGVVGFGSLGEATGRLMHAIGMNVIYTSRSNKHSDFAQYVSLDELLQESDVVSLHCALTMDTENLIDQKELKAMKPGAFLINTARGGIANEKAVVDAIENNDIAGVAFDVLIQEPPSQGSSPLLDITHYNNVILTPHNAWSSQEAMQALSDTVISNIEAFHRGDAQNLVSSLN